MKNQTFKVGQQIVKHWTGDSFSIIEANEQVDDKVGFVYGRVISPDKGIHFIETPLMSPHGIKQIHDPRPQYLSILKVDTYFASRIAMELFDRVLLARTNEDMFVSIRTPGSNDDHLICVDTEDLSKACICFEIDLSKLQMQKKNGKGIIEQDTKDFSEQKLAGFVWSDATHTYFNRFALVRVKDLNEHWKNPLRNTIDLEKISVEIETFFSANDIDVEK